jgi:hypothetical protein
LNFSAQSQRTRASTEPFAGNLLAFLIIVADRKVLREITLSIIQVSLCLGSNHQLTLSQATPPMCLTGTIPNCLAKNLCYFHFAFASARATSGKLVMCHFAPSPTSEALFCSAAAAAGLRRALRIAAIRFCASSFFTCLKVIFLTQETNTVMEQWKQVCGGTGLMDFMPKAARCLDCPAFLRALENRTD